MTVGPNDIVSCLVRNEQQPLPRLTLVKQVVERQRRHRVADRVDVERGRPDDAHRAHRQHPAVTNVRSCRPAPTTSPSRAAAARHYAAGPWSCTGATSFTATSVTLDADDVATCTIVNNDQPAHLTLVKTVENNFGGTAVPTDWTLNATGPTPISGVTGSAAVTNATVNAGNYTIFESNGPPGYVSGAWSCTTTLRTLFRTADNLDARRSGSRRRARSPTVDAPAQLTLVKQVTNNNGGTAAPTAWTLTADGPEILDGSDRYSRRDERDRADRAPTGSRRPGPPGYAASAWVCTGATQSTATSVTLGIGQSATCTITNDDIAGTAHALEGRHQRQRRHRGRDRLDVERGRADDRDLRRDRHAAGDGRPGAAGHLRAVGDRSRPARLRGFGLGVHGRGGERRRPR